MGFLRKAGGAEAASSGAAAEAGACAGDSGGGVACSLPLMVDCVGWEGRVEEGGGVRRSRYYHVNFARRPAPATLRRHQHEEDEEKVVEMVAGLGCASVSCAYWSME